jgi:hypothetical protein
MSASSRRAAGLVGLLLAPLLLVLVPAMAGGGDPQLLFTENITAVGTSLAVTTMEQALLVRLDGATTSIDAALYDFNRATIRDALIAAHNRGVSVRVVADDDAYAAASYHPSFVALEAAGIPLVLDNRSSIMHNKFFIIDGVVVWSGSANLTNTDLTYNHNNSVVFTSTLLADIYTLEFEEMFGGTFGTAKTDNVTHTLTYAGFPLEIYFSPSDGAMAEVINEVNSASESIAFSIFFLTEDDLRDALIAKSQDGVTISGVWDLLGASNLYSDDEALCAAGIPIKIEDFGGKMHNKFMVIDANGSAPRVITGSMNWSGAGGSANDENTVILHDVVVAQAYQAAYEELYDALGPETLCAAGPDGEFYLFLPLVMKPVPLPTATPTPVATATPTASPTPTLVATAAPTATPTQPGSGTTGNVVITTIFYDGAGSQEPDEYVEIRNEDTFPIQLSGWTLRDIANHVYTFPSFLIQPGQVCRVYTNQTHPQWCSFSYGNGSAVWNNGGDCAYLRDSTATLIDDYCY